MSFTFLLYCSNNLLNYLYLQNRFCCFSCPTLFYEREIVSVNVGCFSIFSTDIINQLTSDNIIFASLALEYYLEELNQFMLRISWQKLVSWETEILSSVL